MFTARTVVIVALGAGGIAASSASAVERTPNIKSAPAATASMPLTRRVTAQKVTEDLT
jgi:hypothetical protein